MINLRTRLLVGYGYMAVLLLLTAGTAAFGFFTINEAISRILSDNFRSVSASFELMNSLERQNTLTKVALLEDSDGNDRLAEADRAFEEALEFAKTNVTVEGEEQALVAVREAFDEYLAARDRTLSVSPDEQTGLTIYVREVSPKFVETRQAVVALMEINHDAILEADEEARATAVHMVGLLGVLVTVALISMVFLSRALQTHILSRLANLNKVAEAVLTGHHGRRFDTSVNDELGVVASQLNGALDALDELQAEMRGRLNQQKQLVLGLLEGMDDEMLLIGLDGKLVASTSVALRTGDHQALQDWLVEKRKEILREFRDSGEPVVTHTTLGNQRFEVRLLAAEGRRPVAWAVRPIDNGVTKAEESSETKSDRP